MAVLLDKKIKLCNKCKQEKPLSEFYQHKSGKDKGYYRSICKKCSNLASNIYFKTIYRERSKDKIRTYRKEYNRRCPWVRYHKSAYSRCKYATDTWSKYYKYMKFDMTIYDFKELWLRDKAWLLKRPSIDRIDSSKGYIKSNCRFIKLVDNAKNHRCLKGEHWKKVHGESIR